MPEAMACGCSVDPVGWFGLVDPACEVLLVLDRKQQVLAGFPHQSAALLLPLCKLPSLEELFGKVAATLLHDRITVADDAQRPTSVDLTLSSGDGDTALPCHVRISLEDDKVLLYLRMTLVDGKQMRHSFRSDDQSFWQLFEAAPIPLAVEIAADATSHGSSRFNKKFTSVFGYDEHDVPSVQNWWPLAYPNPRYRESVRTHWFSGVQRSLQGDAVPPMQTTVVCKDGSQREIEFGVATIGGHHVVTFVDLTEQKRAERALTCRVAELDAALRELRTLRGLLPVCAWCRRLRSDRGYWLELEEFLEQAGEVTVTHGICPECRGRHFAQSDRSQAKPPGGSRQS